MKTIRMVVRNFSVYICCWIFFFPISACHVNESRLDVDSSKWPSSEIELVKSCPPTSFTVNGGEQTFHLADMIGKGAVGAVYSLKQSSGEISSSHVIKIIGDQDRRKAYRFAVNESILAANFDQFFVETQFIEFAAYLNDKNKTVYLAALMKQRVNGETLSSLRRNGGHSIISVWPKAKLAYDRLQVFKKELALKMVEQSRRDIYLTDLHPGNIMYDGQRWYLVDGMLLKKRKRFAKYFRATKLEGHEHLVTTIEDESMELTEEHFQISIDLQLGRFQNELAAIAAKQAPL